MPIFLKKVKAPGLRCYIENKHDEETWCRLFHEHCNGVNCRNKIFLETPRPPDGTRCRDLDGNIKVVGRDV